MDEDKYFDSFSDLELHIRDLLSEIERWEPKSVENSYLSFLDNFLVLVDQIITDFQEGKTDNEELAYLMSEKQNVIMTTLSNIISCQKEGNWKEISRIITENLEKEIEEWKETVNNFFSK
ncbi:hypothetical protein KKB18_00035 [bacterium]|nr:hypothetical protein [bacterium]